MTHMHEIREQVAEKASYTSLHLPATLQRTEAYAAAHRTSRALPLSLFDQPVIGAFRKLVPIKRFELIAR